MRSPREIARAAASVLVGALWLTAAGAKIAQPLEAYEFAARLLGPGAPTKAALAATVAGETALGAAMLLRAARGLALSLAGLAALTAALARVRMTTGGFVPCGCFASLLGADVDDALARNAVLLGVLAALLAWDRLARRAPSPRNL